MAAPIDLSAVTTIEGQLMRCMEALADLQRDTDVANADALAVVTTHNYNDTTGIYTFAGAIDAESASAGGGFTVTPVEAFYPKVG